MSHSTKVSAKSNDFPLWQRKDGRWCRKIRGRVHYFGTDQEAALDEWLRVKDYLLAGRTPPSKDNPDALTLEVLVNKYLAAKKADVDAGEYSTRTFQNVFFACERIVDHFGQRRLVADIRQDDFAGYRALLVKNEFASSTINVEIASCKAIFNWAYQVELIEAPVRFGPQFKASLKSARRQNGKAPAKMFEPEEIKALIGKAGAQAKAMILLGVNCGFGNTDCSALPKSALDLKSGWVTFPRPKTGVERRSALWPETLAAVRLAIANRPDPKNPEDDGHVFLTTHGNPWVRMESGKSEGKEARWQDAITVTFRALVKRVGLTQRGRGFYTLRRVFRTIADETGDWPAVNMVMGHTDPTIGGVYRQRIDDNRLKAVADHVRAWLFGQTEGGAS